MDSWNRKLRMGMVGGGPGSFIGPVHCMVVAMEQQAEMVAGVFSRDPDLNRETGAELYLDPGRVYDSYTEMATAEAALPSDERIDFVSIVTPNVSHFDICRTFLEAGIHVVCDKPMTYTLEQSEQLVEIVEESGLVFALTHNYTGHPMVRQARALFRSGQMGRVRKVIVEYLQDFLATPHEKLGMRQAEWRLDPARSGIGATIGDIGTHAFNLLEYVTGEKVSEMCVDLSTFLPDRTLDEDVNALLRLEGGGKGLLTASQIATGEENGITLRVYAEHGAIRWGQENPNYMDVWRLGEPRQTFSRAQGYLMPTPRPPAASRPAIRRGTWRPLPRSTLAPSPPSAATSTAIRCRRRSTTSPRRTTGSAACNSSTARWSRRGRGRRGCRCE